MTYAVYEDDLLGQVINGHYRLDRILASGGMGTIYRATQLPLLRQVVVKMVHPHLLSDKRVRVRFEREARGMTQFSHPGCVMIFDYGHWQGKPFIVMELVAGRSLEQVLAEDHPLPIPRIVELISQACDVLGAAHEAGLVHRDIKPENIIIQPLPDNKERVKLIDFGLAVPIERPPEERLTEKGGTMGTPYYMSPEQCRGKDLDARADIYALGVVLYELLCGEPPFVGNVAMEIFMQHMLQPAEPPSNRIEVRPVPLALDRLVEQTLAKKPGSRPQSMRDFRERLISAWRGHLVAGGKERLGNESVRNRAERQRALGLRTVEKAPAVVGDEHFNLLVVENSASFADSLISTLRQHDLTPQSVTLEELVLFPDPSPGAAVIDCRGLVLELFDEVLSRLEQGRINGLPVVLVGPDETLELMNRSLEVGISDYVPDSRIARILPRAIRRLIRRETRDSRQQS